MWRAALVFALMLVACNPSAPIRQSSRPPSPSASSNPTLGSSPQASPSSLTTPTSPPLGNLVCTLQPAPGDPLVLIARVATGNDPELMVFDAVNPAAPVQDCTLAPATGGRFITATRIAFWVGKSLRIADIASGSIALTTSLSALAGDGAFSADGSLFAYRVGDDSGGLSTHLFVTGRDRILLTRPGIGGHGGTPAGPTSQLEFSADGKYLLSVDSLFAVFPSGPPNFLVYDQNGSTVFQSSTAAFGRWAKQGDNLYFGAESEPHGVVREVHSWNPVTGETTVARGLADYSWPTLAPDNRSLLFDSFDSAGLPHLWKVDIDSGALTQLATGISSAPVFVGTAVSWSNEEEPCNCGPGGASAPDEKLVAHDLQTGHETSFGLVTYGHMDTRFILDVWLH